MKKVCDRLKSDREFKKVYNKGRSFVSPVLVTYCLKKKYGNIKDFYLCRCCAIKYFSLCC